MAFLQCDFKSETLGLSVSLNVILNQKSLLGGEARRSPVLYLLHGLSDDHTTWMRRTSIERYAEAYDLAVVMPSVNRSFYANMHSGPRYWDFVADELPALCQAFFPIASGREDTFVAGLSMGGYGAFKLALARPEQYAAAASLSGALDLEALADDRDELLPEWRSVFGPAEAFAQGPNDLMGLATAAAARPSCPALYQCCGREDYLYPINRTFRDHSVALGLPLTYEEGPGDHDWAYWDLQIQRVLRWLPLRPAVESAAPPTSPPTAASSLRP